jgi:hypothetical protein
MIIKEYFQFLFPFFFVTFLICYSSSWIDLKKYGDGWYKVIVLIVSACLTFIPFGGLSLADYLLSVNPNFSIGSTALIIVLGMPRLFHNIALDEKHLILFCLWNVSLSLILFYSYLGLTTYDLYALGYGFSFWFLIMAFITLLTVWFWTPLSVIFIACIAAFNLRLLTSDNFFDYLTDGFLLVMSLGVLFSYAVKYRSSRAWFQKSAA